MPTDFNPGDRVRYIGTYTTSLYGKTGTVRDQSSFSNVYVDWDTDHDRKGVLPDNLELINDTPKETAVITEPKTADEIQAEFDAFKKRVGETAMRLAQEHGWCSVVDSALEELEIPKPALPRSYRITIELKPGDIDGDFQPRGYEDDENLYFTYVRAVRDNYFDASCMIQSYTVERIFD